MKLRDLRKAIESLPDETPVCAAEVEEAFGAYIRSVDVVKDARERPDDAAEVEKYELSGGGSTVVVLRHG